MDVLAQIRGLLSKSKLNPTSNNGDNFWGGKGGDVLSQVQRIVYKGENAPKVSFQFGQNIRNPILKSAVGLGRSMAEEFANTPSNYIRGITRTGNDLGSMIRGDMKFNPVRLLSSAAPTAGSILNTATFGAGSSLVKGAGKQTLKQIVKQGASTGAKYGAGFGGLSGLEQSRFDTPKKALTSAAMNSLLGGVFGGVAGGALAGTGYGISKAVNSYKALSPLEKQKGGVDTEVLKPISDRVKAVHKLIFGDNRIPKSKRGLGAAEPNRYDDNPLLASQKVVDMLNRKSAKEKVNIFDYISTPEKVFEKLGMKNEASLLRKGYDTYRRELKEEISKVSQWQKRVPDKVSSERIFNYLDGQKVDLAPDEMGVAIEIKDYLSKWADRMDIPYQSRISNYITHIFEKGDIELEFNPDIAKLIENKVPGSTYNPFLEKRANKQGYIKDAWRALDAYVKRATRKVNIDPALDRIEMASNKLDTESFKYIQRYISKVNMRPAEIDNLVDNAVKSVLGYKYTNRPTAYLSKKVRQTIYRATLGLNPGSALKNLSQGANTYAVLGEKYTLKGYWSLIKKMAGNDLDELYKVGVLDDQFIQDRSIHAVKRTMEKVDPILFGMFEWAEKVNRGSAYFGAKSKFLDKGLSEEAAIEAAKKLVRQTQFAFGSIDTPLALQGDITKIFTQFMGYSIKQGEFLLDMAAKKDIAGLARYTGSMLVFMASLGKLIGMDIEEIIPSIRLKAPTVQLGENIVGLFNPDDRTTPKKALTGIAALTIPAGTQLKKTIEGLGTVGRGYSQTETGRVRFPVDQKTSNYVRGGLFGQWNLDEAKDYFKKERSPLGDKQSEVFKSSDDKLSTYQQIIQKRESDKQEDKVKELVSSTGVNSYYGDKYFYLKDGEVKSIQTDFQPTKPKLTGYKEIDKNLISQYKSELTKRKNIVLDMFENGLITEKEAEEELNKLQELRNGLSSGGSGGSRKKVSFIKIKAPNKISTLKIKGHNPKTIKIKAPDTVKLSNLKARKIWS